MQKILVSACLLGEAVRYDGAAHGPFAQLQAWQAEGRVLALCPEMAGGLPTPRPPAEILGGQGRAVLAGQQVVRDCHGRDVSDAFRAGAARALALVREQGIGMAVLKARSPSCGNRQTYSGEFSGRLVEGAGVTAAALQAAGVVVFNEYELEQAAAWLALQAD
ncbi:DUF523 domain-containing protein [Pseudomonas fluvialis]|jgi:uncharacterized protein YbbK (DUF523 family)|uniref:DUF523 domain-containing protein n=1 Tax=Pseudomonas fluvialis TaxID=1793966 RepID=A0ABQ2AR97_9PSED|nr:DUF523 domain-containing protein [Pseudomonas fluvialis]OXM41795.1 purine-nucleoside phosphorylase [Pseudomonas fluvialis]GGH93972.1 hypothetical protein GCM10007363_19830 [Pseudomonas fluvialis]